MKKLLLLLIPVLFAGMASCDRDKSDEGILANQKGLVIDLSLPADALCGLPLKFQSYWVDGLTYVNTGSVEIAVDANFLYMGVHCGYGFQPVSDNIDLGFYKSLPTSTPDPASLHYHFTSSTNLYYITIPLSEITFENGDVGMNCGEPIYIMLHTDTYISLSPDRLPLGAWVGKPDKQYISYTPPCCITCSSETAWGGNSIGAGKAWWYYFDVSAGLVQNIYAGKTELIGTVTYNPTAGTLTVNLTGGWVLDIVDDNLDGMPDNETVKIQGYNVIPLVRPEAGLFTTYKGNSMTVNVPPFTYYAIHLDVVICK
jgi:hypothetical protein